MVGRIARESPRPGRGVCLTLAGLLLSGAVLTPILHEREERRRLDRSLESTLDLQARSLHRRVARSREELQRWGLALVRGERAPHDAQRMAGELVAATPELRRIVRVDEALVPRLVEPRSRVRSEDSAPVGPSNSRTAAQLAQQTRFAASSEAFQVPGDGACIDTWIPLHDERGPHGLVGATYSLEVLLSALISGEEGSSSRLEVLDARGATVAARGLADRQLAEGGAALSLRPYGIPLSLRLRAAPPAFALGPWLGAAVAAFVALLLIARALRRDTRASESLAEARTGGALDALALVAASPAPLAVFGTDLRCLACSRRWFELLGRAPRMPEGLPFTELVPGGRRHWAGVLERALRGASERRLLEVLRSPDGSRLRLSWRLEPIGAEGAQPDGFSFLLEEVRPIAAPLPRDGMAEHQGAFANSRRVEPVRAEEVRASSMPRGFSAPFRLDVSSSPKRLQPSAAVDNTTAHEAPPQIAHDAPTEVPAALPEVVLLAEGDPFAREAGSRLLRRAGFDAVAAADTTETLEWVQQRPGEVLCVLLALDLPGRGGLETLHLLRRLRRDLPVLLVAGPQDREPTPEERDGCPVLQRPFRTAQLDRACRLALSQRRALAQVFLPTGAG